MAQGNPFFGDGRAGHLGAFVKHRRGLLRDYFTAMSGTAGRLVFSLIYFMAVANALKLGDFGLFAASSAAGVMLARLLGFGFIAALYRTATVRRRLIGVYTGGALLFGVASLPVVAVAAALVYVVFFRGDISFTVFGMFVAAEVLLWRPTEAVMIVNNGMGRFARAATFAILSSAIRSVAAAMFYFSADHSLIVWAWWYVGACSASLIVGACFFYPRQRIKLNLSVYWRRLPDSFYAAGAELLFYFQMEFDKLLVLSLTSPQVAGVYAIIMRLVDLTAIPVRTFSMMLVQKLMRMPQWLGSLRRRIGIEAGIFLISTLGILVLGGILQVYPRLLGSNVATAAPLVLLAFAIPGLRNLAEYHGELLFARGQTLAWAGILAAMAAIKGGLLYYLLTHLESEAPFVLWLNLMFFVLYLLSATLTYSLLGKKVARV